MDHPPPTPVCSACGEAWSGHVVDSDGVQVCPVLSSRIGVDGSKLETQVDLAAPTSSVTEVAGAVAPAHPPRRFAHYALATDQTAGHWPIELGRGAMGVTYLARDTILDCPVALKVIDPGISAVYPEARTRFLREAKAAASLRHPNVANVFHYGEEDGNCFYAMELVEGETLQERVRRDGPLPPALAIEVTRQVAQALMAAEARGIVHRDLKPANIMVCHGQGYGGGGGDGLVVKVIDFGLAKAVATAAATGGETSDLTHGGFVGTPAYASPEQVGADGARVDPRSDIYSLGVTLWFLLTAKVPFPGRNLDEIHDRQLHRPLPLEQLDRTRVTPPVVALLRRMLAADPARRPQNARDLARQLLLCRESLTEVVGSVTGIGVAARNPPHRARVLLAVGIIAVLGTFAAWGFLTRGPGVVPPGGISAAQLPVVSPAERSVAVLPFENLSDDKANAFFADGVQEEILTHLTRVAELKVISRSSVLQYRDASKRVNLSEIARALGVTHIVEGSVQRAGNQIRINATLIDARNDAHRWAEHYDRDLSNVFALQSEIAERIAASLRAKLSPFERAAIDAQPTTNLGAYDLYLQARELVEGFQETPDWRETLLRAVRLLDEATRRDGRFALAWCLAAKAHDQLYFTGLDASPLRLAMQENAVNLALRLQPDLAEAHLARARLLYRGRRDYEGARRELDVARAAMPNSAEVFSLAGYLDRRLGRWPESLTSQERAFSLDPRNPTITSDRTVLLDMLRRYPEEILAAEAAMDALPGSRDYYRLVKAAAQLSAGRTGAARADLNALPPGYDPNGATTYARVCAGLYDNRPQEAREALAAFRGEEMPCFNGYMAPRAWVEALVSRSAGDAGPAEAAMRGARTSAEAAVRQRPDDPFAVALLAQIDAGLGRKEEALRGGRRAVEMRPVSADAMDGPGLQMALAMVCAWTGEKDEAMQLLLALAEAPGGPEFGQLRYDPAWAGLRGRADFQAMLARLEPRPGP